jgi:EmrB/QacA subfamily drug resistance transporter
MGPICLGMNTESPTPPAFTLPPNIKVIFAALMLVLLLASLDQTIVSTALPTIAGQFHGLAHLSWIVTAYLLSSTVVGPIYGKMGDVRGRKRMLQIAITVFLIGSALCGLSQNLMQLIVFRAVQGLGGGGLIVTTLAMIADLIPLRERGRYQGLFGAVFGLSTIIGPLVGGFFVEHLTWRWIFYINLPLGLLALGVIGVSLQHPTARRGHGMDYLGIFLLAAFLSALTLATSLGGVTMAWSSPGMMGLSAGSAVLLAAFLFNETRVAEPLVPLGLFRTRLFSVANGITLIVGFSLFGSVTYMPLYLQVVKGISPTLSGLQITPMMGGMLVTSILSGRLITRLGRYKLFPVIGTALITLALFLLSRLTAESRAWAAMTDMVILGLGLGNTMQVMVLVVQNSVTPDRVGIATSISTLSRSVGGALGVSLFGALFAHRLASLAGKALPAGMALPDPRNLASLPPQYHDAYVHAFDAALQPVFALASALAIVAFGLALCLKDVPLRGKAAARPAPE